MKSPGETTVKSVTDMQDGQVEEAWPPGAFRFYEGMLANVNMACIEKYSMYEYHARAAQNSSKMGMGDLGTPHDALFDLKRHGQDSSFLPISRLTER